MCGGVVILAHPNTVGHGDYESFITGVKRISEYGIDGFEISKYLSNEQLFYLNYLKREMDLLVDKNTGRNKKIIFTTGSDFHYMNQIMGREDENNLWKQTKELIKTR